MQVFSISAQPRLELGKKGAKATRKEGLIPCILYGGQDTVPFSVAFNDIKGLIYTPDFKVAEISINGSIYRCIVKEIQFHPVTDAISHIDFLYLATGSPIKVDLPLRFTGTSPGVKAGGKLLQKVRRVKVKAMPENLVDEITLDISSLELGQSIRIRDIKGINGIEIMNSPGIPVATIEIPRALRSAATAEAKAGGKK